MRIERRRVLVVDDDAAVLRSVARVLGNRFDVTATTEPREALRLAVANKFDAIVTDLEMPSLDGSELIAQIRGLESYGRAPIIVLTGTLSSEVAGATVVLHKPADVLRVADVVGAAIAEADEHASKVVVA